MQEEFTTKDFKIEGKVGKLHISIPINFPPNNLSHRAKFSISAKKLCINYLQRIFQSACNNLQDTTYINEEKINELLKPYFNNLLRNFMENLSHLQDTFKDDDLSENTEEQKYNACLSYLETLEADNCKQFSDDEFKDLSKTKKLLTVCDIFCKATQDNLTRLFDRINEDKPLIKKAFLNDFEDPILTCIHPTGGDYHNKANQVLILEFQDKSDPSKNRKVVYKPAPVLADAVIIGDSTQLNSLEESFVQVDKIETPSFAEIMNKNLNSNEKIDTYLVVPCKDNKGNSMITNHYGYIQYIDRYPSIKNNRELLNIIANKKDNNFIVNTNEENIEDRIKEYSHQCGLLISLMLATGLIDSHDENLIARVELDKLCRYLIDLEISFDLSKRTLDNTSCMHGSGSLRSAFEIDAIHNIFFKQSNQIVTPPLDRDLIKRGITQGFKIIKEENPQIKEWFNKIKNKNFPVRFLPATTTYLQSFLTTLQVNCFDLKSFYSSYFYETQIDFKNWAECPKRALFYCGENLNSFLQELYSLSLPTCYINIHSKEIQLSNGSLFKMPTEKEIISQLGIEGYIHFLCIQIEELIKFAKEDYLELTKPLFLNLLKYRKTEGYKQLEIQLVANIEKKDYQERILIFLDTYKPIVESDLETIQDDQALTVDTFFPISPIEHAQDELAKIVYDIDKFVESMDDLPSSETLKGSVMITFEAELDSEPVKCCSIM